MLITLCNTWMASITYISYTTSNLMLSPSHSSSAHVSEDSVKYSNSNVDSASYSSFTDLAGISNSFLFLINCTLLLPLAGLVSSILDPIKTVPCASQPTP